MKSFASHVVLLLAGIHSVASKGRAIQTAEIDRNDDDPLVTPQVNRGGWVNPEDLPPMPQCIAQQDQSAWLSAMTKCTEKRCTRHFGIICTHHQWLTELSCLSTSFSPDLLRGYLPYCSRSILAKAQLYQWVHTVTGRTWIVDVGDGNRLQDPSPVALTRGYASVEVTYKAPKCLENSASYPSMESFDSVIASCGFESATRHTGNAARPWEYRESIRSMVALDSEIVGYNLTGHSISSGEYFDKQCFCRNFAMNTENEPCSDPVHLDMTKERLWIHATCGSSALPYTWMAGLKTTPFPYIPTRDWRWPACADDMPKPFTIVAGQCAEDACGLDSGGYCKVQRAIDRACFCHQISYDSCSGSCHIFEGRIDYVNWLHDLCGKVENWYGLPRDWRRLAAPFAIDLIPWQWTVRPNTKFQSSLPAQLESTKSTKLCASNDSTLGAFALIHMATLLAICLSFNRRSASRKEKSNTTQDSPYWAFEGILIASLQLVANYVNAIFIESTCGYGDIPIIQLALLWSSVPRPYWILTLVPISKDIGAFSSSWVASLVFGEVILQMISSYYMLMTVNYGRKHSFYYGRLEDAEKGGAAKLMYAGALLWLILMVVAVAQLLRTVWRMQESADAHKANLPTPQRDMPNVPSFTEEFIAQLNQDCQSIWGFPSSQGEGKGGFAQETSPMRDKQENSFGYGTFSEQKIPPQQQSLAALHITVILVMILLWVAQWLFWAGFLELGSGLFCLPNLGILTVVWAIPSLLMVYFMKESMR